MRKFYFFTALVLISSAIYAQQMRQLPQTLRNEKSNVIDKPAVFNPNGLTEVMQMQTPPIQRVP